MGEMFRFVLLEPTSSLDWTQKCLIDGTYPLSNCTVQLQSVLGSKRGPGLRHVSRR